MESTQESSARLASEQQRRQEQIEANAEGQRRSILESVAIRSTLNTATTAARTWLSAQTLGVSEFAIRAYKNRQYILYAFIAIISLILLQIIVAYNVATTLYENKSKLAETVVEVLIENGSCRELAGKSFGDKALGGLYDPDTKDELTNCTAYIFTETDLVRKNGSRLNPAD